MAALPAAAQGDEGVSAEPVVAAIDAAVRVEVWPAAAAGLPALPRLVDGSAAAQVVDYRLWLGAGRAALGFGLAGVAPSRDFTAGPWAAGTGASSMVVGVRYQLTDRSRVYVDTASLALQPERDLRLGFEFKSAPSTALGIARGTLFRVQWNSRSHVSLRVRSGGVAVALRSQFY